MEKNRLFVYGTLLGSLSNSMADYLKRESQFLGEAYLRGRLYDLGQYPGLVPDENSPYLVYGHVFELYSPETALKILDHYEDIPDGKETTNEYIRSLLNVSLENKPFDCWVYIYNHSTQGLKEIKSGNYLEYIETNPRHKQFIDSV